MDTRKIVRFMFNVIYKIQGKLLKLVFFWIAFFIIISIAWSFVNYTNKDLELITKYINLAIAILGLATVGLIMLCIMAIPITLFDKIKNPSNIPDTADYYENTQNFLSIKEAVKRKRDYLDALLYSIKGTIFHIAIWVLFTILVFNLVFAIVFLAVERSCSNGGFKDLDKNDNLYKYLYFSLITFTTVGFGDISPEGEDALPYIAIILEIVAAAYIVFILTLIASGIFFEYSVRKEDFSLFLENLTAPDNKHSDTNNGKNHSKPIPPIVHD